MHIAAVPFRLSGHSVKRTFIKISTNKHKVKGLGQAFFPKGLRVSRGQSHLVAVRRQRNLFACGINDKIVSRLTNKSQSRLHSEFKTLQMNIIFQFKQKTFSCRRLETKRRSVRNVDFGFRRKAQARTNTLFIFMKSVPCKGDTTRWKGKLKQGQKTAFPFPLMVSPCLAKGKHSSLP